MSLQTYLKERWKDASEGHTPAYFFDVDVFEERVRQVRAVLGEQIPLTYSIKANPFLLHCLPDAIAHVEVCSPGELTICQKMGIPAERIIYSGVMKEETDIRRAMEYGVDIFTAESLRHLELENALADACGKIKVILRLTSGNQFGMSVEDIHYIIGHAQQYEHVQLYGIHYYSGTQKKKMKQLEKDIAKLTDLLENLWQKYGYMPSLVEYGPGLAVDYFSGQSEISEAEALHDASELIRAFAQKYPVGIEMGRFLAASCGTYVTQVKDLKNSCETNYAICDGGIHHLKYYGQNMAMQIPPIWVNPAHIQERETYCICGSLCTVADVLVREVELPKLSVGDILGFGRCGAYSVTEGSLFFLSRTMPEIYLYCEDRGSSRLREFIPADRFNMADHGREVLSWD